MTFLLINIVNCDFNLFAAIDDILHAKIPARHETVCRLYVLLL